MNNKTMTYEQFVAAGFSTQSQMATPNIGFNLPTLDGYHMKIKGRALDDDELEPPIDIHDEDEEE